MKDNRSWLCEEFGCLRLLFSRPFLFPLPFTAFSLNQFLGR
jgi:hypothetical protein